MDFNLSTIKCAKCQRDIPEDAVFCCYCGKALVQKPHTKRRGNGEGSVFKRADTGSWCAKINIGSKVVDGKTRYVTRSKSGFRTKKEALEFIQTFSKDSSKRVPTVLMLWDQYKESGYTKLSKSKQTAYNIAFGRMKSIEHKQIDQVTLHDVQSAINDNTSTYYPAKDMRDLLSHFFQAAEIDGFVSRNLSKYVTLPELAETIPIPFTKEEQKALWDDYASGNWWTGYILLMIYTSMMPGELMGCKKEYINLETKQIIGAGKKTSVRKNSEIVLADIMLPVVQDLCDRTEGEKIIRINKDNFYKKFKETIKRLNLNPELTPYSCRHTTATALVEADIQPSVIQNVMRHSKFSSTQRYIHVSNEAAHNAVNKI